MTLLSRLACRLGLHLYDAADVSRRARSAARIGVNVRHVSHWPADCQRCGKRIWVKANV